MVESSLMSTIMSTCSADSLVSFSSPTVSGYAEPTAMWTVGSAYPETVGEGNEVNESAEHVDMIVDMSEDSTIEVDGEVVQRDGTFRVEDGFEA